MENENTERPGFLDSVAGVLNAGGSAAVKAVDATTGGFSRLFSSVKGSIACAKKTEAGEGETGEPLKIKQMEKMIREHEREIKILYYEIGKKGAEQENVDNPMASDEIKELLVSVKEHKEEIAGLESRILAVKEAAVTRKLRKEELKKEAKLQKLKKHRVHTEAYYQKVDRELEGIVNAAVTADDFSSRDFQEMFYKVAHDLLDSEFEIKSLAAAELGKMGDAKAVPILVKAAEYDDGDLTCRIIDALTELKDPSGAAFFKEKTADPHPDVRIAALTALHKALPAEESMPVFTTALDDEHPEVRRTVLTRLGWEKYEKAVGKVVKALMDPEPVVRKAAVSALSNIKSEVAVPPLFQLLLDKEAEIRAKALEAIGNINGKELSLDVTNRDKALTESVMELKDAWQESLKAAEPAPEAGEGTAKSAETKESESPSTEPEKEGERKDTASKTEIPALKATDLKKMTKAELLELCKERKIETKGKPTTNDLIKLLLPSSGE